MSMRRWYTDLEVNAEYVIATVDISGIVLKELWVGISNSLNSLVLKYLNFVKDIPLPVKVTDSFEYSANNGVLVVVIKRLI